MTKLSTFIKIIASACLAIPSIIIAQDIHFSQFYMAPMHVNPAMTGVMQAKQRVSFQYRNQWSGLYASQAYQTFSANYEQRWNVGIRDYFGLGVGLWHDQAGANNFGSTQLMMGGSYSKKLGGRKNNAHFIAVGVQSGIAQRRIGQGDLRWLSQVDSEARYCPSCGFEEILERNTMIYPDISLGLMWYSMWGNGHNWYGGIAWHHLNTPNVAFFEEQADLHSRFTVNMGLEYAIDRRQSLKPKLIIMNQGPHSELNAGLSWRWATRGNSQSIKPQFIELGAWYRIAKSIEDQWQSDAAILMMRFDVEQYQVGLSYDFTLSELRSARATQGAFELSVWYIFPTELPSRIICPEF